MRYSVLAALIAVPALAGCGSSTGVTTGGQAPARLAPTSVHATCPKSNRQTPVSRTPGAGAALVPGHPEAIVLCRYSGLNGHPRLTLIGRRTVTNAATVARLARELDALPKPTPGAVNCPADFGDAVIAIFAYPTGDADPVTVGLSGCQSVGNGHLSRLAGFARSAVVRQLAALTPR